jgi:Tol biopolymer transport system component
VANVSGTGAHQITTCHGQWCGGEDNWPVWSPDGSQIAFDLDTGNSSQVAVVPASGGRVTVITKEPDHHASPSW